MLASRFSALRSSAAYFAYLALATAVVLLFVEGALRIGFGLPRGMFNFRPQDGTTLFAPNSDMHLVWDVFPYTISTNSLGFRGPDIALEKPVGTTRILALGDSVTAGFYVNNPQTYPRQLEQHLRGRGRAVEVINAGLGDTTLDTQRAIFMRHGLQLQPDMVLLTFVANDIDDLRGKTREEMRRVELVPDSAQAQSEWLFFGRTAIGEVILDRATQWRMSRYREHRRQLQRGEVDGNPVLEGATDFDANVRVFLEEHARPREGIAYFEEYDAEQLDAIGDYLYLLDELHAQCRDADIELRFVYFPDYPEVYDASRKVPLNDILQDACAERGIPFLDLLPAFRAQGDAVLHFAPVDFHPNARGNAVMAEAVADWLEIEQ